MDDTLFNSLFVADESATVSEKSETTAWPIYPSENPTKAEKIIWLQRFEYDARMSGYSASLRREDNGRAVSPARVGSFGVAPAQHTSTRTCTPTMHTPAHNSMILHKHDTSTFLHMQADVF